MNIELGKLPNGNMVIVGDSVFPCEVARVEYYREQRLIMLVYEGDDNLDDLMHYELNDDSRETIEKSPNAVIISAPPGGEMFGYDVPIIQVGEIY